MSGLQDLNHRTGLTGYFLVVESNFILVEDALMRQLLEWGCTVCGQQTLHLRDTLHLEGGSFNWTYDIQSWGSRDNVAQDEAEEHPITQGKWYLQQSAHQTEQWRVMEVHCSWRSSRWRSFSIVNNISNDFAVRGKAFENNATESFAYSTENQVMKCK